MNQRPRLTLLIAATALTLAILLGFGAMSNLESAMFDTAAHHLRQKTEYLATECADTPENELQKLVLAAGQGLGVRVRVYNEQGEVLADSGYDLPPDENKTFARLEEIIGARAQGYGTSLRRSLDSGEKEFHGAARIRGEGNARFVTLSLPADQMGAPGPIGWLTGMLTLGAVFMLAMAAYVSVRGLLRPVERMSDTAERIAGGELQLEVPEEGREEVVRLAAAVNRMKHVLVDKIQEQDQERALLASVVAGMEEGLLLVSPDGRVQLANRAITHIFDLRFAPQGRLLGQVVRDPKILRAVESALQDGREIRESVIRPTSGGRSFELRVTPLENPAAGAVVLLFDITRMEALEGVRREFVANVSHELRTPLTSIKAFVETLLSAGLEDRENSLRFLEIIGKHADRMGALIEDITDLSRIETGSVELQLQTVDAAQLCRDIVEHLDPMSSQRGIKVHIDIEGSFQVRADRRRLDQVLTNLIDNAIKFNRPDGEVYIRGLQQEDRRSLVIEDTGVGIPADSLEKIFHRFYRVDAARSREAGGTGLGLAIVKHLMRLHGGKIEVDSELGRGSRFVLEFPPVNQEEPEQTPA